MDLCQFSCLVKLFYYSVYIVILLLLLSFLAALMVNNDEYINYRVKNYNDVRLTSTNTLLQNWPWLSCAINK